MAKLLFVDTFNQENGDGSVNLGWSVINFPCFVVIEEIIIVPQGAILSDQLPFKVACSGKTQPSQFRVNFYACDVNNAMSSTFEEFCMIDFNENTRTTVLPRLPFILNQLIFHGCYNSMTMAIFGCEAVDTSSLHSIHKRRSTGINLTNEVLMRINPQTDLSFFYSSSQPPSVANSNFHFTPNDFTFPHMPQNETNFPPRFHRDFERPLQPNNHLPVAMDSLSSKVGNQASDQRHLATDCVKMHYSSDSETSTHDDVSDSYDVSDDEMVTDDVYTPEAPLTFNPFLTPTFPLQHMTHPEETKYEAMMRTKLDDNDITAVRRIEAVLDEFGGDDDTDGVINTRLMCNKIAGRETRWIEVMESLADDVNPHLCHLERDDVTRARIIARWCVMAVMTTDGLLPERLGLNVRLLKVGLRLTLAMTRTSLDNVTNLCRHGLMTQLLTLLGNRHIATPIKLAAIHCIDGVTDWPLNIDDVIISKGGYAKLVALTTEHLNARVAEALERLMRKLHLYQSMQMTSQIARCYADHASRHLCDFNDDDVIDEFDAKTETCDVIIDDVTSSPKPDRPNSAEIPLFDEDSDDDVICSPKESYVSVEDSSLFTWINDVSNKHLDLICNCLRDVTQVFDDVRSTITQLPIQQLPVKDQLPDNDQMKISCKRSTSCFFRMSHQSGLVTSLLLLTSLPRVSAHRRLFSSIYRLITRLLRHEDSIFHLLHPSNNSASLQLARNLMTSSSPHLDVERIGSAGHLGALLATHLHIATSMDAIQGSIEVDDVTELQETLRALYGLLYLPWGKREVSKTLSQPRCFALLLNCVWMKTQTDDDVTGDYYVIKAQILTSSITEVKNGESEKPAMTSHHYKSAINISATLLLLNIIKYSDDVTYLLRHIDTIVERCVTSEAHVTTRSNELRHWLKPLANFDALDDVTQMMTKLLDYVTQNCDESDKVVTSLPGFCIALRLLRHICGVDDVTMTSSMKLQRVTQLVAAGGNNTLMKMIENVVTSLSDVSRYNVALLGIETRDVITIFITHQVAFLRFFTSYLIEANVAVDVSRMTSSLLDVHVIAFQLLWWIDFSLLHVITRDVIAILVTLLPCSNESQVLKVMTSHMKSRCDHFIPDLTLLTNLLPIPLPLTTTDHCTAAHLPHTLKQVSTIWSQTLQPALDDLIAFMTSLLTSSCRPLIQLLVTCLQQLIDVCDVTASRVVIKLIKAIPNKEVENEKGFSCDDVTALMTICEVMTLPAARAAFLHLLRHQQSLDDHVTKVLKLAMTSEDAQTVATVMSLALMTLDLDASLMTSSTDFPPIKLLHDVINLSVTCLSRHVNDHVITERATFALLQIVSDKSTSGFVADVIIENPDWLREALSAVTSQAKREAAFMTSLQHLVHLLAALVVDDVTMNELCWLVDVDCILQMEELLADDVTDYEDAIAFDCVTSLRQSLQQATKQQPRGSRAPKTLMTSSTLEKQFQSRQVINCDVTNDVVTIVREAITSSPAIHVVSGGSVVERDLTQVAMTSSGDKIDLESELKKMSKSACDVIMFSTSRFDANNDASSVASDNLVIASEAFSARKRNRVTYAKRSHGLLSQQKSGNRALNPHNRPYDLFRHRKQNTSRPPSMHVDDYEAADVADDVMMTSQQQAENGSETKSTSSRVNNTRGRRGNSFTPTSSDKLKLKPLMTSSTPATTRFQRPSNIYRNSNQLRNKTENNPTFTSPSNMRDFSQLQRSSVANSNQSRAFNKHFSTQRRTTNRFSSPNSKRGFKHVRNFTR